MSEQKFSDDGAELKLNRELTMGLLSQEEYRMNTTTIATSNATTTDKLKRLLAEATPTERLILEQIDTYGDPSLHVAALAEAAGAITYAERSALVIVIDRLEGNGALAGNATAEWMLTPEMQQVMADHTAH